MSEYTYRVELRAGQASREIAADSFGIMEPWMIFYRKPPQGGKTEYWRVQLAEVISMETRRHG